ncbi:MULTISPECIES: ABC transporter ATP-binding protein [unclassified Variovorax]|uniref:ABC transporter ATP-binding protein n=1 Tax=unclassified Variovorax TaxID=663243 RepID=UPI00076BD740|nr:MULTISPECIES: ABC transporter ATP-binding protein [unclassified Variovorax]KWT74698.1 Branched-chain amino acid transport ATP-binding protein LivG [Variovorax sp. WDL1]PNG53082.1 Lipopolysaccharide export system ATP-binding protein LptB [Variovorax sp. B2]PNG53654.1 Lipopolysaccharide export system ATP-binding protein LptB [Variovorax sp. B4]VTV11091.1 Lipopolysaccharide export system ATP-binding protein LptB [Variovorax sp. WDL1]
MNGPGIDGAGAILTARGLTRSFSGFTAVSNVDLVVRRNTVHSVIGPNGAGKSTLFNLLTRFLEPDAGSIVYKGADVTRTPPAQLARQGVVRSFQISAVFPHLTVAQNVCVPLQRLSGLQKVFWRSTACLSELDDRVHALLRKFGLSEWADTAAGELPYGRKRALELATTFALEPDLVLLDEPMAGLGMEDVTRVSDLIADLAGEKTIVMVEHNLKVVERLSDTVTVLCRGEVLAEGSYAEVAADPRVLEAYIGH